MVRQYAHKALLALLLVATPSCTFFGGSASVFVSSTPAGARILVDGVDSGETTPARLEFGGNLNLGGMLASDRVVTLTKRGFAPEKRVLHHHTSVGTSRWIDGATGNVVFSWPLHWTFGDFFTPFAVRWTYVPSELHVDLFPEGEAPGQWP